MGDTLEYLAGFARFPFALRRYLARPLTLDEARRIVSDRLLHRDDNFLAIVERAVYGNPASPYLALLRLAGCELGDLRALVAREGLDGALRSLRQSGVYVTYEEFKGRTPIVRGSTRLAAAARDFDNPFARRDLTLSTGGSTGLSTAVSHDLDYIAATAPLPMLMLDAWDVLDAPSVHWTQILPAGGLRFILQRAHFNRQPVAWHSQQGWFDSRSWPKYDAATLYTLFWMRALGVRVGVPAITRPGAALTVARELRRLTDAHGRCVFYGSASSALRVALAAEAAGLDLTGATIRAGGEPLTDAKVAPMRRVGARVMPAYGAVETGSIGLGCTRPAATDQVHVATDSLALITHPLAIEGTGITVNALNLTSLVAASPKVMLNYQIDDHAVVEERDCGCPLHAAGFTTSIHTIRSYSKLLGEGVTLAGTEVQRVLEEVLPARFGGSPLDYQLMEDEDEQGFTRLCLLISPRVSLDDDQEPARVLLRAVRLSSLRGDSGGAVWDRAGTLRVVRREPISTARGKLLPLHSRRSAGRL